MKWKIGQLLSKNSIVLLIALAIIVFLGFKPLFEYAPEGVSKELLVAGIGAIFVTLISLFLLEQQASQAKENLLREKKLEEYFAAVKLVRDGVADNILSQDELNNIKFGILTLQLVGSPTAVSAYNKVFEKMNEAFERESQSLSVDSPSFLLLDDHSSELFELVQVFSNECRLDMNLLQISADDSSKITTNVSKNTSARVVRQEISINETFKNANYSDEESKKTKELISFFENTLGLKAKGTNTQISIAPHSGGIKSGQNIAYLNKRKNYLNIGLAIPQGTLEEVVTAWAHRFNKIELDVQQSIRKGQPNLQILFEWNNWPKKEKINNFQEALNDYKNELF